MLSFWGLVQLNSPHFPTSGVEKTANKCKERQGLYLHRNIWWIPIGTSPDTAPGCYRYVFSNYLKLLQTHSFDKKGIRLLLIAIIHNTAFVFNVTCTYSVRKAHCAWLCCCSPSADFDALQPSAGTYRLRHTESTKWRGTETQNATIWDSASLLSW